jgi:thioredoxin reductase (NADPH)
VHLDTGDGIAARSVIIATGVSYRTIDVAGIDRFHGCGVYYEPLVGAEEIPSGAPVVIVGGGNSAGQAAIWPAGRGHPVTLAVRGTDLAENMSRYLTERITGRDDIEVRYRTVVRSVDGAQRLDRVEVEELTTGTRDTRTAAALFVLAGAAPHTGWLAGSVRLDDAGYVVTGPALGPIPGTRRRGPAVTVTRTCWRPAHPACSRPAMYAPVRSSGPPPRSAKVPSRSGRQRVPGPPRRVRRARRR